jgi:hypothetical protein
MSQRTEIEPIVSLKSKFDPTELETIEHARKVTVEGVEQSTKVKVPLLTSESGDEAFLYLLTQFKHARTVMQWTTGPILLQSFRLHLQGSYISDWDDNLAATVDDAVQDVDFFQDQVANLNC